MKLWDVLVLVFGLLLIAAACPALGGALSTLEEEFLLYASTPDQEGSGDVTTGITVPVTSVTQTEVTVTANAFCGGLGDFEPCHKADYGCKNGKCYCKGEEPFCRCNNYKDEWFLGDKCSQKWTVVQFALVASLPGLGLAVIVGVTVHLVHYFRKPKSCTDAEGPKKERPAPSTSFGDSRPGNMYTNPVFASDVGNNRRSELPKTAQENISMMNRPFSYYSHQPSASSQSYNNPYSKATRNPYEDASGSSAQSGDYRRSAQNGITRGFQQASLSSPSYSAPDYDTRPQFPRAQMGRYY